MTDASRSTRPDRRAVLGGLLVGAAAASAPVTWARAEDKDPPPPSEHRAHRDRCPADRAFRAQPAGGEAVRGARVPRRHGADLPVGRLRRLVGPGHGAGRQEPACHLRRRQLAQRRSRLRRQPAERPDARAARPAARQGRPAARAQGRAGCGSRDAGRRHLAARHAADRLRAPPPHRPLSDPRRRGAGADGHLEAPRRGQAHAAPTRASRPWPSSRAAPTRARSSPLPSASRAAAAITRAGSGSAAASRSASSCRTSTASTSPTRPACRTAACSCSSATSAGPRA